MPSHFDLIITADYPNLTAELRLLDTHGSQLAFRQVDFKNITVSRQYGLFDLGNYLRYYVEPGQGAATVAEISVCIAEEVMGADIFLKLWQSESQRTLRIQLPGASEKENHLAAALARVPWEIARPAADQPTLGERNLLVRVVHDMREPATQPLPLGPDECMRVLFVFAEARGSWPLAVRRERLELLKLFEKEIYPQRRVVADFLTHGVTRERLEEQIADSGGYHIIHWSGHGHLNLLELAKPGGAQDTLTGKELLVLFTKAGGFIPRLFFLSACHSGDILRVKDWNDFLTIAQGQEPGTKQAPATEIKEIRLDQQPGYTGTAHALLQGGVPSVVAMRYSVGDDYARDLGVEFYRTLLAQTQPKTVAAALTMARQSLLDPQKHQTDRYYVCDHATPVLYGAAQPGLALQQGRSPALDIRNRRLHQIAELTIARHEHFVGRTWELAGLGADFIGSRTGAEVKPVALITGLGGMGKTALTAEALALWESRFEWMLLYQAKPNALGFDATLRDIDLKLRAELDRYHDHVRSYPADAIFRAADAEFTGPERLERLTGNLVRALRDEAILLVLDNFETNLKPQPEPSSAAGEPVWACQDPAWDRCLTQLAAGLVDTPSRVLITSRRPLAALAEIACQRVLLGPLPSDEAALYLREHAGLREMVFSGDGEERDLALRLLRASRFHPLLMDRLARLATGGPALRPQLLQALETLETSSDFTQLPALFATAPGDAQELAYLENALATSLDQLIRAVSPDARRLLWMIAVANEPVSIELLRGAWMGETRMQQQLRKIKQVLDMLPLIDQARMQAMVDAKMQARLDALPAAPARSDPAPLLRQLVAVGLATKEEVTGPEDPNPEITCHELVRERIHSWMKDRLEDRAELTENTVRIAYAEYLKEEFYVLQHRVLQHRNMTAALQAGSRAMIYCVQAGAYDRLIGFISGVVTGTIDTQLLASLLPHLETAADSAPEGQQRWCCIGSLAEALSRGGRPDVSLPFFEQAANQARIAAETQEENRSGAWMDLAVIFGNWGNALSTINELDAARQRLLESVEAYKKAGVSAIGVIASELTTLRIDIRLGRAEQALPQVETKLGQLAAWWRQYRAGTLPTDAPDSNQIAGGLINALSVANECDRAKGDWESALQRTEAAIEVKRELKLPAMDIASSMMNRAGELLQLGRFGEARTDLEACLQAFQNDPTRSARTLATLAHLFYRQNDLPQAIAQERRALAIFENLPDPGGRGKSHTNLANYLKSSATPYDLAEASRHQLAGLVYILVSGLGQDLQYSLANYAIDFRNAHAAGTTPNVPSLAELLAPPFRALKEWLRQQQADVAKVQIAVDKLIDRIRQAALSQK